MGGVGRGALAVVGMTGLAGVWAAGVPWAWGPDVCLVAASVAGARGGRWYGVGVGAVLGVVREAVAPGPLWAHVAATAGGGGVASVVAERVSQWGWSGRGGAWAGARGTVAAWDGGRGAAGDSRGWRSWWWPVTAGSVASGVIWMLVSSVDTWLVSVVVDVVTKLAPQAMVDGTVGVGVAWVMGWWGGRARGM